MRKSKKLIVLMLTLFLAIQSSNARCVVCISNGSITKCHVFQNASCADGDVPSGSVATYEGQSGTIAVACKDFLIRTKKPSILYNSKGLAVFVDGTLVTAIASDYLENNYKNLKNGSVDQIASILTQDNGVVSLNRLAAMAKELNAELRLVNELPSATNCELCNDINAALQRKSCPPWDKKTLSQSFSYKPSGTGLNSTYTVQFTPNSAVVNQLNAYLAYLHSLNPAVTKLCLYGRIHCYGAASNSAGTGPSSPNPVSASTCNGTQYLDVVPPFWLCFSYPANTQTYPVTVFPNGISLCPNMWYCIYTETGNDPGPNLFNKECVGNKVYFRWSVNEAQRTSENNSGTLQFSDGNQIIGLSELNENPQPADLKNTVDDKPKKTIRRPILINPR